MIKQEQNNSWHCLRYEGIIIFSRYIAIIFHLVWDVGVLQEEDLFDVAPGCFCAWTQTGSVIVIE